MADLNLQRRILQLLSDGEERTDYEILLETGPAVPEVVLAERLDLLSADHLEVSGYTPVRHLPLYSLTASGRKLAGAPGKEATS